MKECNIKKKEQQNQQMEETNMNKRKERKHGIIPNNRRISDK